MVAGVPLRDVLALPALRDARVVAGAPGLGHAVRRVNVMEVPDILRWVNPDELLLTTAYPLREDRSALLELVPGLAAKGLAGLAVKPARYIESIPPEMVAAADALAFPLIELPQDSSFNDIINSVLTVILNAQAARLQRSAEIHERFTAIVLGGGGLAQIADALADAIGRPVAILDAAHVVQTVTRGAESIGRRGARATMPAGNGQVHDEAGAGRVVARAGDAVATIQPIQVGGERFGAIVAVGDGPLDDDQVDALEYAATVGALRQVQARAVAEADRRFQAVCLEELVTGHVDRAVLTERAAAFHWDLAVSRAVVLARVDEIGGQPIGHVAGSSQETAVRRRLAEVVRATLPRGTISWERSTEVAALVPAADGEDAVIDNARRLLAEAARAVPDATVSAGVGRVAADPLRLSESHRDARRALEIGRWGRGPGGVSAFRDLGVDRLLIGLPDAELSDFGTMMLGPLLDHDARHGTELVRTLDAFLGSPTAAHAARRLFVHYNTLKNRLRLIEEVLGPLDDPDRALGLAVALRIRRLPRS